VTRVLHSVASIRPETGGPARSVPALVDCLVEAGVDARLNVCEQTPSSGRRKWSASYFAVDLGGWRPELVHDHGVWLPSNHQAAAYATRHGIPRVVSPRGMLEPWSLNHRRWKKRAAWAIYQGGDLKRAACLHATSPQEAEQLRKLGLRQPIIVLPNGVRLPDAGPDQRRPDRGFRTALFMSRIHPKKGLPLLLEAWAKLRPEDWRLRIVGPDELDHVREVRELAGRLGIESAVSVEGEVDDRQKWSIYEAADLFVLPTYSENFGIVVAEALAARSPVITTTGTPWRELAEWKCGWCVEPTAEAIHDSLRAAVGLTDEQRQEMGNAGRRVVLERFSWDAIATAMRDAYQWILGGGEPPACVRVG